MRSKFWLLLLVFAIACDDEASEGQLGDGSLATLRADIQFSVTPGLDRATSLIRFRRTVQGLGVSLPNSELFLNGEPLPSDSTEMNGVFFEKQIPLDSFFREHVIEIKENGKVHQEKFSIKPFTLPEGFPAPVKGQDMLFSVAGVEDGETVLVMMLDTSFSNQDLQKKIAVKDGQFVVPAAALDSLAPGPVSAEVHYERKIISENLPVRRGTITIRQMVSGEFMLENQP